MKPYHPSILSWAIVLGFSSLFFLYGNSVIDYIPYLLGLTLAILMIAGQVISMVWGVYGIVIHSHKKDALIALSLSGLWFLLLIIGGYD